MKIQSFLTRIICATRTHAKLITLAAVALCISVPFVWAESTKNANGLWEFHTGEKIESGKVNENFSSLRALLAKYESAILLTEDGVVVEGTVSADSFQGSASGLTGLGAKFASIQAYVGAAGNGQGQTGPVTYCPDGYSIAFWALTSNHMGADNGWFYCDCSVSGNGIYASINNREYQTYNSCACNGLCVQN